MSALPVGTRLVVGTEAVLEVTPVPHLGCPKFERRFGHGAQSAVTSDLGKELRLRGVYCIVVTPGCIHTGDRIRKA
jgi:MOSC domain-containing protein YiiM